MVLDRVSSTLTIRTSNEASPLDLVGKADVAELVDAPASGAGGRKAVWVRVPPSAPY